MNVYLLSLIILFLLGALDRRVIYSPHYLKAKY